MIQVIKVVRVFQIKQVRLAHLRVDFPVIFFSPLLSIQSVHKGTTQQHFIFGNNACFSFNSEVLRGENMVLTQTIRIIIALIEYTYFQRPQLDDLFVL